MQDFYFYITTVQLLLKLSPYLSSYFGEHNVTITRRNDKTMQNKL